MARRYHHHVYVDGQRLPSCPVCAARLWQPTGTDTAGQHAQRRRRSVARSEGWVYVMAVVLAVGLVVGSLVASLAWGAQWATR